MSAPIILYSAALDTAAAAAGAPLLEIQNNSNAGVQFAVTEIGLVLAAATASNVGLVDAHVKGTVSTSQAFVQETSGGAALTTALIATAWSVAPTIANSPIYYRRVDAPAVAGTSILWDFGDNPFVVGTSLLVWNFGSGASSILNAYVRGYPIVL